METPMQGQPAPGWWSRNWKWFLPTGCCLGTLLVLILAVAVFGFSIFAIFSGVSAALKSSEPYKVAVARAKADVRVTTALGKPVEEGFPTGSVNTQNNTGDVDFKIPISGPKGKGTIYVVGTKSGGTWTYSKMSVTIDGTGDTIDLIP
ncbi:MAG: cytochrome c oxidase assembly factor 1 family protein [Verrucomicrobiota bacterium]|nr:cytochrome c oxidase assembly factor 1 family protein [Verrucomicrobiota bacterium]